MTHPDDLLAELEDGTLADGERAALERHLASCARCREQLVLARSARSALGGVPDADAPGDIGAAAIEEARARPTGAPSWSRWVAAAAAVAAVVVAIALIAPKIGAGNEMRAASNPEAAVPAATPTVEHPATSIEAQDTNYDAASIAAIADSYRGKRVSFAGAFAAATNVPQPVSGLEPAFETASACLQRASSGAGGQLVRLIRARYQGAPAYVGVYVVGPGADEPADSVRVLVVPIGSCTTILSSAAAKL